MIKWISAVALIFLLSVPESASAQSREHYLKLSKRQNTWGWIVAGTVPVFITAGFLVNERPERGYVEPPQILSDKAQMFVSAGTAAIISSILFVASSKNRKKAISLGAAYRNSVPEIKVLVRLN